MRKVRRRHVTDCDLFLQFPGWIINSEGSVFITTTNDNAVGVYTCTAYNSYGTMGQSEPTQVILQVTPSPTPPTLPSPIIRVLWPQEDPPHPPPAFPPGPSLLQGASQA